MRLIVDAGAVCAVGLGLLVSSPAKADLLGSIATSSKLSPDGNLWITTTPLQAVSSAGFAQTYSMQLKPYTPSGSTLNDLFNLNSTYSYTSDTSSNQGAIIPTYYVPSFIPHSPTGWNVGAVLEANYVNTGNSNFIRNCSPG